MLGGEPATGFEQAETHVPPAGRGQRGGGLPAVHPGLPGGRDAFDGGAWDHRGRRRVHHAQGREGELQLKEQAVFLLPGRTPEVIEERGGEVVETGTAVEQEHLAQDPGEGPYSSIQILWNSIIHAPPGGEGSKRSNHRGTSSLYLLWLLT